MGKIEKEKDMITRRKFIKTTGALAAGLGPSLYFPERVASMKTDKKPVKALVFDAYGTLFDVRSVITALNQKFPGLGPAVSNEWRTKQLEYTWLRSSMGRYEDFWKVTESALVFTCNDMKLTCDAATRAQLMESYLHLDPFPEVRQALKSLSGRPLAILSNGTLKMLQAVVESAGLRGTFVHIISVDEVRTYKPSPAAYQLAVRKLGVDKTDIGFVSSNFWDDAGAKAFGFRTYWVNRSGAPADELSVTPDVTLTSLTDLVDLIKA
jgi:2-haloacid dehalogenase